jgi:hypothetical protein
VVIQIAHHAVLGRGLGVHAIRARGWLGTKVEPAEVMLCGVPAIDAPVPATIVQRHAAAVTPAG